MKEQEGNDQYLVEIFRENKFNIVCRILRGGRWKNSFFKSKKDYIVPENGSISSRVACIITKPTLIMINSG